MKKEFKRKILLISLFFNIIIQNIILINSEAEENRIIRLKELNLDSKETYVPVKSGHNFTIELEGNPTTGYSWFLETPEKLEKEGLLIPKNLNDKNSGEYYRRNEVDKNKNEVNKLGSGGIYHFKFLAGEKNGHEEITFIYKRPWKTDAEASNLIKKSINVKVVNIDKQTDL
jgi:predicted secreted protein